MATGDHTWTKLAIGAAIAVKMGAVYVDIKQTQAFFEEGFEGNPKLVKFVFAMTGDGTAKRATIAQNNFWIATYLTCWRCQCSSAQPDTSFRWSLSP